MKRINYFPIILLFVVSCTQVKDIAYLQQANQGLSTVNQGVYAAKIKPGDLLYISIISSEPEASRRFNLMTPYTTGIIGGEQETIQNYLVENDGTIKLPVLGTIEASDLTTAELKTLIEENLSTYFSGEIPVITIRITNYSVNILGEVNTPGKHYSTNERLTIFEGLALANDMTIFGKRDNVKVLRENENGEVDIYTLNLSDSRVFNSPAFFLQQNDVVYVEPNQSRANSSRYGAAENYRVTTLSMLVSVATMVVTIFGVTRR